MDEERRTPPGARLVTSPTGRRVVMSAVEAGFYWALQSLGMAPEPRWEVDGRRLDFAFPHFAVGVEADGAGDVAESASRWRRAGWKVIQFEPAELQADPAGCAETVRQTLAVARGDRAARAHARSPLRTAPYWVLVTAGILVAILVARQS